jgi:hypothetical protein
MCIWSCLVLCIHLIFGSIFHIWEETCGLCLSDLSFGLFHFTWCPLIPSIYLYTTQFCSSLWLSNTPLYICHCINISNIYQVFLSSAHSTKPFSCQALDSMTFLLGRFYFIIGFFKIRKWRLRLWNMFTISVEEGTNQMVWCELGCQLDWLRPVLVSPPMIREAWVYAVGLDARLLGPWAEFQLQAYSEPE